MSEKIDLSKLLKAQEIFERFRKNITDEQYQAGAVQAFEFSYELAWKMMKRILIARGLEVGSPKDTFRKAALENIIDDPEVWFEFLEKRNLTVHTYEQKNLDEIVASFDDFSKELKSAITRMKEMV